MDICHEGKKSIWLLQRLEPFAWKCPISLSASSTGPSKGLGKPTDGLRLAMIGDCLIFLEYAAVFLQLMPCSCRVLMKSQILW